MSIQVRHEGIVYRNPKPHLRSRHAYFPSVAVLPDGRFFAAFDLGSAFEAADVRSYYATSEDEGKTWSDPKPVPLPPFPKPFSGTCRFCVSPEGELVGLGALFDRSREDEGLASLETGGFVETHPFLIRADAASLDGHVPQLLSLPLAGPLEICSAPFFAPGGDWLWPASTWKDWSGFAPQGMQAIVIRSKDRGRTWDSWNPVMDGRSRNVIHWEIKLAALADGRLLAVCWTHDAEANKDLPIHYALSEDGGRTFSAPASSGLIGQTCTPLVLADGRILSIYRRTGRPGLWAQLSAIEGKTWSNVEEIRLWAGASHAQEGAGEAQMATERMSALRFGLPASVLLKNGMVFAAFWCVEDAVSVIRHFTISPE